MLSEFAHERLRPHERLLVVESPLKPRRDNSIRNCRDVLLELGAKAGVEVIAPIVSVAHPAGLRAMTDEAGCLDARLTPQIVLGWTVYARALGLNYTPLDYFAAIETAYQGELRDVGVGNLYQAAAFMLLNSGKAQSVRAEKREIFNRVTKTMAEPAACSFSTVCRTAEAMRVPMKRYEILGFMLEQYAQREPRSEVNLAAAVILSARDYAGSSTWNDLHAAVKRVLNLDARTASVMNRILNEIRRP